jgi:3-oxoacyl-[acyl-carrier-protein] synthase II
MREEAAITGIGPVSALGIGADNFWNALLEGRSGFRRLTRCDSPRRGCAIAAEVEEIEPLPLDGLSPMPRAVQLALHAARLACEDAQLKSDPARTGVVVGSGIGNIDLIESSMSIIQQGRRLSPVTGFRSFTHAAACEIAREFNLSGPIQTVTSGCNSGADALGLALDWIRLGRADAVIVGGTEAELSKGFLEVMTAARALTARYNDSPEEASRPFDSNRDGNVPGEGAAFLVIENMNHARARSARTRACLKGFANRAAGARPAYDPFNPVFDSTPMLRAMQSALADAGINANSVSAISANGSSSVFYDPLEADAINRLMGDKTPSTPVYSIKGSLGQTGAVTPVLQAITATLSLENNVIPQTINASAIDPRCSLFLVRDEPRPMNMDYVLANAIGFGGFYYASMIFGAE